MGERTRFLYRLVRLPAFYAKIQSVLRKDSTARRLKEDIIRPQTGLRVLDVGCGPGSLRSLLGDVDYTGIDLNPKHIETAKKNGRPGDKYMIGNVVSDLYFDPARFDLLLLIGILHHIDDDDCKKLFKKLATLVKDGGRIVTFDGVYLERQRVISKLLLNLDAGKNVRTVAEYSSLCEDLPFHVKINIFSDFLKFPYDHCAMTITNQAK